MSHSETGPDKKWEQYRRDGRVEFITFHPAYTYEEFIEGITVETSGENIPTDELQYTLKAGMFKNLCKRALGDAIGLPLGQIKNKSWKEIYENYLSRSKPIAFEKAPRYVLIIDEINRGDIAKVFGELITLLEEDKRIGAENELIVTLPYSRDQYGIPPNLYIIGTMNTADRSIALLDVALRRRFGFVEMNPDFEALKKEHLLKNEDNFEEGVSGLLEKSILAIQKINREICKDKSIGRDRQIGHSFLFKVYTKRDLMLVWEYEIFPLLEEYCYSDYGKINRILFNKDSDTQWIGESMGIKGIENVEEMLNEIPKNE